MDSYRSFSDDFSRSFFGNTFDPSCVLKNPSGILPEDLPEITAGIPFVNSSISSLENYP